MIRCPYEAVHLYVAEVWQTVRVNWQTRCRPYAEWHLPYRERCLTWELFQLDANASLRPPNVWCPISRCLGVCGKRGRFFCSPPRIGLICENWDKTTSRSGRVQTDSDQSMALLANYYNRRAKKRVNNLLNVPSAVWSIEWYVRIMRGLSVVRLLPRAGMVYY